jgi:DNA-binding PadR family transcriptional regulator
VNRTRFAVLGFLTIRPLSRYDMKVTIQSSIRNFWSGSAGQLYPALRELSSEGLAIRQGRIRLVSPATGFGEGRAVPAIG